MINRITNPIIAQTISDPLKKALQECSFTGDIPAAANYLIRNITNSHLGLFVARSEEKVIGIIACILPTSPLASSPEIILVANWSKSSHVATELIETAITFAKDADYHTMMICNRSNAPDKVIERRYRKEGRTLRRIGTMLEFTEY